MGLYDSPYLTKSESEARGIVWTTGIEKAYQTFCEQRSREAERLLKEFLQIDSLCLITDTYMGVYADETGNLFGNGHNPSIVIYMGITPTMEHSAQIFDVKRFDPDTNGYTWQFSDPQELDEE